MKKKYLLYIDILGFSEIVEKNPDEVIRIYSTIDKMNVHNHDYFKTIVFSDTILVYNIYEPCDRSGHSYLIMFFCEFVKDMLHRFVSKNLFFRALLSYETFEHSYLKNLECFYGQALLNNYKHEKKYNHMGCLSTNTRINTMRYSRHPDMMMPSVLYT